MQPRPDLLTLAPRAGAGWIAAARLGEARAACARLAAGDDPEALHDFRVAVRRLRSHLRAYRPWLAGQVPRRFGKRLKRVARTTNAARDAEVQLEWLAAVRSAGAQRAGLGWWRARLAGARDAAYAEVRASVVPGFDTLAARLAAAFEAVPADSVAATDDFAAAAGALLDEHASALAEQLAAIASLADIERIHAARIAAKRLRYLLEPIAPLVADGARLIRRLKTFQDHLGILNDSFVRERELGTAVEAAGAERARAALARALGGARRARPAPDPLPGLLALARRVRRESARHYGAVRARYLGRRAQGFVRPFHALAARLAGTAFDNGD
jgi:CHAD domain-containing protein